MRDTWLAGQEAWSGKIYSDGWRLPGDGSMDVTEKATGASLGEIGVASSGDVAAAAARARAAQVEWAQVPGPLRGDVLRDFSRLVLERADEIAEQIVRETGSIGPKGQWEVQMTARESLEAANLGSEPIGIMAATAEVGRRSFARRVPIGVVGIITPWNSPFLLGMRAIGPALVTGNAVLLKPDPQTPVCGGAIFAQLLAEAGLPAGLFHVLPGDTPTGEAVVSEPLVDMVSFTGSTRAGRLIGAAAGGMLKRVSLELGGNNPYVVLPGVDIEAAASAGAWGSFFHQGQICLTAGRHLVHESIAEEYAQALVKHALSLAVGDPYAGQVHLGPIVNERQAANVDRVVAETVEQGATILVGGDRDGLFFKPTVMTGVRPGMPAFDEEIFGPVAPIATFSTDDEAIDLANRTSYGLAAAVVGPDLARAQRIADGIHAGIVHINDQPVLHEVYGPIGGVGASGNGFNHSTLTNADQFTEWKWMTVRDEIASYPF
ncbi:benzaldehyde dehydrogenase [Streptomyces sp. SID13031]|uniref:benzaldehyde dehydrogenase n=1 Tax=Streptomyces sp. SID13031 TaxID=2706046 RepID=UPI0013C59FB9|nr:benzaldehyde dehydrogenase [Streptomyces sp. SID13031]NEA31319.1 benzaldehyde dehydrogenase [Streptomyces sp. SID13031]